MRISDWSSDVCSADLDYTRFRDSGQLTGLVGYNPDFELSPGFMVGDAVAGTGIDPNDYLLNKKNFYSSYGYNDTGEADLDKPQNRSSGKGVSATLDVDLGHNGLPEARAALPSEPRRQRSGHRLCSRHHPCPPSEDRKRVVWGKRGSDRV